MCNMMIWACGVPAPAVYIHPVAGDGRNVMAACKSIDCPPFNLISLYDIDFDSCMTPWEAPGVRKGQGCFAGKALEHLACITERVFPEVESRLGSSTITYNAIAGYSLAGLFALWSLWNTDRFSRAACGSASFWYPGFVEYAQTHRIMRKPDFIYYSLGDNESGTKHPVMSQVGVCTERILALTERLAIPHVFETNPGNHFSDPDGRLARAIKKMLLG